jgi:hypothetical protein
MGTIKLVLGVSVIAVFVYISAAIIPIYYANYEFTEAVKTEATMQTYTTKTEAAIQDTVYKKAVDLGVPIEKARLQVHRTGNQGNGSLTIEAPYTVSVNFPGYPLVLNFDSSSTNASPQ